MRLFMSPDKLTGFALKGDDIVSVFKHPDSGAKNAASAMLDLAIDQGGRRLDCFDTQLPYIYAAHGFQSVGRLKFDPQYQPEGWSADKFKAFNKGQPDVVFMVYKPDQPKKYVAGDGEYLTEYDEGAKRQKLALKDYNPYHAPPGSPEGGQFTSGGGGGIAGFPKDAVIRDGSLQTAIDRGGWEMKAKPYKRGYAEGFDVTVSIKKTGEAVEFPGRTKATTNLYNPRLADLVKTDEGTIIERTSAKPKPGVLTEIQPLDGKDIIYRGMSFEEYQNIQKTGEVRSLGEYNIGDKQKGLTYFSTDPGTAAYYANDFAPWQYKAQFDRPAYVIAVHKPEKTVDVQGTGEHEVGVPDGIPKSEIIGVWRGDVYSHRPGEFELRPMGHDGREYGGGSSFSPSTQVAWTREDERSASSLLSEKDKQVDIPAVIASVPGADHHIERARALLSQSVPTDAREDAGGFKTQTGGWTPEREKIHEQIISKLFTPEAVAAATPAAGARPVAALIGGRGGSGKSWFMQSGLVDQTKAIYLNSDDFKAALPEYAGWNAALVHEEASHILSVAENLARDHGLNVIIDGTMRNYKQIEARTAIYKNAGYEIQGYYMYVSPAEAAKRALERFVRGTSGDKMGRFVPPEYVATSVTNEQSFDKAKEVMDKWAIYDNSARTEGGRGQPRLIARRP